MKKSKYFGRNENLTPVVINNATNEKDVGKIINVKIKDCNRNTYLVLKKIWKEKFAA